MDEKEAFDAQQVAIQDLTHRRGRPASPDDALRTYLAGLAYTESHEPDPTRADKAERQQRTDHSP